MQPANCCSFLAFGDLHELLGFTFELDLFGINDGKFQIVVANAGTNLPGGRGILIGGIVADQKNRAGFVKLLHGEQGILGVVTERGDQASVVGGAVVIDVGGAESFARKFLEKIIFFVRSAIRTDEADGVGAIFSVNRFQFCSGGLCGFFPGDWEELIALADHWLLDAIGVLGEIEAEAALDAEKIAVDAAHVAIVGAQNLMIADAESGLAAVRTVGAHGRNVFHFPGAGLVAISAAGERAHRADVNAHAALFAFEMIFAIGDDDAVGAPHTHAESFDVHAFIANTHAAEAENAARSVVINNFRPFFFGTMKFFFDETAGIGAVAENHVLQLALTAFVADRAVERVVGEEKFQNAFASLLDLRSVGSNHHAVGRDQSASGLHLGHLFDFDQAHAAGGLQRKSRVVTEGRNFGSDLLGGFDHQRARGDLQFAVVNFERD